MTPKLFGDKIRLPPVLEKNSMYTTFMQKAVESNKSYQKVQKVLTTLDRFEDNFQTDHDGSDQAVRSFLEKVEKKVRCETPTSSRSHSGEREEKLLVDPKQLINIKKLDPKNFDILKTVEHLEYIEQL
jgi:hypothetical protein